ncbi:hypothetical protein [Streptomyces sp. NPDC004134]|uniref:hypothetical protein n=1 Tax=Streptomyces sp. NPDC004134 TaxID=3364691 RepID=UPI0036A1B38F
MHTARVRTRTRATASAAAATATAAAVAALLTACGPDPELRACKDAMAEDFKHTMETGDEGGGEPPECKEVGDEDLIQVFGEVIKDALGPAAHKDTVREMRDGWGREMLEQWRGTPQ